MRLLSNERYNKILLTLEQKGSVTVQELMETYKVSSETVRRDLSYLERQNRLQRVHGGAIALTKLKTFKKLEQRLDENRDKKKKLSQTAVTLINENDIIAIDAGSTAYEFVSVLKEQLKHLRIVTHSLDVFEQLKNIETFDVMLVGGQFLPEESAFYGDIAIETIKNLHFSKVFIFPFAVSLKNGASDYSVELAGIRKAYMNNADEVIIMADSSKFEKNAFIKLCDINDSFIFVTDDEINRQIYDLYRENNVRLYKQRSDVL